MSSTSGCAIQREGGSFTTTAKTWILRAFQINREQRFSAAEALQDPWLSRVCLLERNRYIRVAVDSKPFCMLSSVQLMSSNADLPQDKELKEKLKELENKIGEKDCMRLKEFMKC